MCAEAAFQLVARFRVVEVITQSEDAVQHTSTAPQCQHGAARFIDRKAQCQLAVPDDVDQPYGVIALFGNVDEAGHLNAFNALGDINESGYRSEEHTSELQSLMRISYAVFCLKKKKYYKQRRKLEE